MEAKTSIKAIIIDFDESAANDLSEILKEFEFVHLIGEANSYEDAKSLLSDTADRIDLVFLDIDLQDEHAMSIMGNIKPETKICFLHKDSVQALMAFEYNSVDYIIKPISPVRINRTLKKIKQLYNDMLLYYIGQTKQRLNLESMILMNIDHELKFIKIKDIVYIEAKGNYTSIALNDGSFFTTYGLIKNWEDKLPTQDFFRIHRSTIVNLHHVSKIERGSYDTGILYLDGRTKPFEVSRSNFSDLKQTFRLMGTN